MNDRDIAVPVTAHKDHTNARSVVKGRVTRLNADYTYTGVGLSGLKQGDYLRLQLDHPGYTSIFTLLMASGVNELPITVTLSDEGGIQSVVFDFASG